MPPKGHRSPGSGRKPSTEPLRRPRSIRFTDLEWAEITATAMARSQTVTAMIRDAIALLRRR